MVGLASHLRALIALLQCDYARALAEVERGIACYVNSPKQDQIGYLINVRGLVLLAQGQTREAASEFIAARKDAVVVPYRRLEGLSALNLAWAQLCQGNRQAATVTAREAADVLAASKAPERESAQALAAACEGEAVDGMLQRLRLAVNGSHGNPTSINPQTKRWRTLPQVCDLVGIRRFSKYSDIAASVPTMCTE